jgi:hypothetical protein
MITSPSRNDSATGFVRLHDADVPVKAVEIPTAPTAVNQGSMKDLQTEEIFDGRYAVDVYKLRSIKPSPRTVAECSIDREKFLRIGVSMGMRAMRAVLYSAYQVRSPPYRDLLTIQAPSKPS